MATIQDTSTDGTIWLASGNGSCLGYERLRLLEEIAAIGYIGRAARDLRLSAQGRLERPVSALDGLADQPPGGTPGRRTPRWRARVTPAGLQLIEMLHQMDMELFP